MRHLFYLFRLISLLCVLNLSGHGFVADTSVHHFGNSPSHIKRVCLSMAKGKRQQVASWDSVSGCWHSARVKAVGHAHVNCTIKVTFDEDTSHNITCTPSQSFYCVANKRWIPAYLLQEGDCLLTESGGSVSVHDVSYRKKPSTVYMLEIKKMHTFCVGHYRVVTHNTPLACTVMIGLSGSFGTGAAAGGATGSFFGPVICVAGCVVGGLLGIATSMVLNSNKIPRYHVTFNTDAIESAVPDKKPKKIGEEGEEKATEDAGKGKEADSGAQAPRNPIVDDPAKQKIIDDIIADANPGDETKGRTTQYIKEGGYAQAEEDFGALGAGKIIEIRAGKAGALTDETDVNVRSTNSRQKITLEIHNKRTNRRIKVRYNA